VTSLKKRKRQQLDLSKQVKIADGVFWVGSSQKTATLNSNPYLIVDGDEAVLIDGGSRFDFSTVVLKIMRTGLELKQISRLIYQNYGPDSCGSLPYLEALIDSPDLQIISHEENNTFIDFISPGIPKECIEAIDLQYKFKSGRRLYFYHVPYAHTAGSFLTYDTKTKILFTGDLYSSLDGSMILYTDLQKDCNTCEPTTVCPRSNMPCELISIADFHIKMMTSANALGYALNQISKLDISMIAPRHGNILHTKLAIELATNQLKTIKSIGIDRYT